MEPTQLKLKEPFEKKEFNMDTNFHHDDEICWNLMGIAIYIMGLLLTVINRNYEIRSGKQI